MKKKYVRSYSPRRKATPKKVKVVEVKKPKEKRIKTPAELEKARQEQLEKRRVRDRLRRALNNADRLSGTLTDGERAVQEIENGSRVEHHSRAPRAFTEDRNKGAIDSTVFDHGIDPDQIEHEHLLESPYQGKVFEKSNPDATAIPFDFPTCDCEDGEECEVCLAQVDVEAIPSCHIKDKVPLPPVNGIQQFKVKIPVVIAETLDRAVG